jgi:hypothetical protein
LGAVSARRTAEVKIFAKKPNSLTRKGWEGRGQNAREVHEVHGVLGSLFGVSGNSVLGAEF